MIAIASHIYDPASVVALTRLDSATTILLVSGHELVIADPAGLDLWTSMLGQSARAEGVLDHALAYAGVDLAALEKLASLPDISPDQKQSSSVSDQQSNQGAVWLDQTILAAMSRVLQTAARAAHNAPEPDQRVPCTILMFVHYQQQLNPPVDPHVDILSTRRLAGIDRSLGLLQDLFDADSTIAFHVPDSRPILPTPTTPPSD